MKIGWLEKKSYGGMVRLREDQKIGSQNEELVEQRCEWNHQVTLTILM